MSVCIDIAEYKWLTGSEAAAYLAELASSEAPIHTALERLRRQSSPAKAHLLLEQTELRRRAKEKFTAADRMFFTRLGLEQATDEWVARYKADRFVSERAGARAHSRSEGRPPVSPRRIADLCCGIGGDLLHLSKQATIVGIDSNPIAAHFAQTNASLLDTPYGVTILIRSVEDFEFNDIAACHIDPDRRASGRRTTSLNSCQPSLDTMEKLLSHVPHVAIKLAPATRVPPDWADRCELEWISRGGECRQLVAWHGDLARSCGLRSATILATACGLAPRTITGRPDQPLPIADGIGDYIFDIDPAVRAARLQGALAAELNLSTLADGPGYLTGDVPVADGAVSCFKIEDILPLRVRTLAQHLRERGIGRLEIKKRGADVNPEKLRRDLKLRGENAAALLITPIAGRPAVIVAQRIS
jgi:hypothetical protein